MGNAHGQSGPCFCSLRRCATHQRMMNRSCGVERSVAICIRKRASDFGELADILLCPPHHAPMCSPFRGCRCCHVFTAVAFTRPGFYTSRDLPRHVATRPRRREAGRQCPSFIGCTAIASLPRTCDNSARVAPKRRSVDPRIDKFHRYLLCICPEFTLAPLADQSTTLHFIEERKASLKQAGGSRWD